MNTETEDEPEDGQWLISMREAKREYDTAALERKQKACTHTELEEHGICLECGANCFDRLIDAAEWRRDALEDR